MPRINDSCWSTFLVVKKKQNQQFLSIKIEWTKIWVAESTFLALQNPRIIESCWSNKETTILVYQNRTYNNHDFKDKDKDEAKAKAKDGCSTAVSVTLQPTWMKTKENILQKRKKTENIQQTQSSQLQWTKCKCFPTKIWIPTIRRRQIEKQQNQQRGKFVPNQNDDSPRKRYQEMHMW